MKRTARPKPEPKAKPQPPEHAALPCPLYPVDSASLRYGTLTRFLMNGRSHAQPSL